MVPGRGGAWGRGRGRRHAHARADGRRRRSRVGPARGGLWLLHPRAEAFPDDLLDLDASRADLARQGLPDHEVAYRHDPDDLGERVRERPGSAGLLLRPARVDQIAEAAHRRVRMPPKTTYFFPKPRTGMVFRSIDR